MTEIAYLSRPYRPCVGIMLLNQKNEVFVAQRIDQRAEAWQMPQGGIDEGEDVQTAALRELAEETSVRDVEVIAESADWYPYDLPREIADEVWKGRYRGQTQKWVLMRLKGDDSAINIATVEPEFSEWQWVSLADLPKLAVSFKREIYQRVADEFSVVLS